MYVSKNTGDLLCGVARVITSGAISQLSEKVVISDLKIIPP